MWLNKVSSSAYVYILPVQRSQILGATHMMTTYAADIISPL